MGRARYDEIADWYDERQGGDDHPSDCTVCHELRSLDDGVSGLVIDLGCGSAAHHRAIESPGRSLVGVDLSPNLAAHASRRLDGVVVGDATSPPVRPASADVVVSTFVHTDLDSPTDLFRAVHDLLRPGGTALVVGAHPCFNNPFFARDDDGRSVVHPGYAQPGFYTDGPGLGHGIRRRAGFHHLPLDQYLNAVVASGLIVERWSEGGPEPPFLLGFRGRRPTIDSARG